MNTDTVPIPDHVPQRLVYDFDYFTLPDCRSSPHMRVAETLAAEAPPIFFSPRNGGHWVVTLGSDAAEMFRITDVFSNDPRYDETREAHETRHLPLQYDPPEHAAARKIFAPLFTPGAVAKMEQATRELAVELIDGVYPRGGCEFVSDIAEKFPVTIFLRLADHKLDDRAALVEMAGRNLRSSDRATALSGLRDLSAYLDKVLEQKRESVGDDLVSRIVRATFLDRDLTHDEQLGAVVFMFLAGLDTVAAMMSWMMAHLATNPERYRELVENPESIKSAVEELCRVSGVAVPARACAQDYVYDGINFKKGDRLVYLLPISGVNDPAIENPEQLDFARERSPHFIFGGGAHRCLGSHLARLEVRVFFEEWVKRIPHFGIEDNQILKSKGGAVWLPNALPLRWA